LFHRKAGQLGIIAREVPTEAHSEVGIVERQHSVLRQAYRAISMDCPDLCKEDRIYMTLRAVIDAAEPDGICATLLVYGVIPNLGALGEPDSPTYAKRAAALKTATKIASEFSEKKAIQRALSQRSAPHE
jgi:hypothetical protein